MDLHRTVTVIDIHALERLLRKIHTIELKIHSFKGGVYGKD